MSAQILPYNSYPSKVCVLIIRGHRAGTKLLCKFVLINNMLKLPYGIYLRSDLGVVGCVVLPTSMQSYLHQVPSRSKALFSKCAPQNFIFLSCEFDE